MTDTTTPATHPAYPASALRISAIAPSPHNRQADDAKQSKGSAQ